ncbi:MAG: SEC59/DGK1/VTE5 family protein, partial [Nanoarchaeota archaeon]|nr:SEC59/DGK1/VTE5 family protein [Nanoarchaeota archaeon]
EIKRQPAHILLGLFIVVLVYHDILSTLMLVLAIVTALGFSFLVKKVRPKKVSRLLQFLEREDDLEKFPVKGLIAYLIGTLLVFLLFEKDIVMASVMMLALGDSFSRLIGPFGRIAHPFNNTKFLEGLVAGAIAASLGAMLFVSPLKAIVASVIAMILEGLDLKIHKLNINDNISIPLVAGTVIWLIGLL